MRAENHVIERSTNGVELMKSILFDHLRCLDKSTLMAAKNNIVEAIANGGGLEGFGISLVSELDDSDLVAYVSFGNENLSEEDAAKYGGSIRSEIEIRVPEELDLTYNYFHDEKIDFLTVIDVLIAMRDLGINGF